MKLFDAQKNLISKNVILADTFWQRLRGLLGKKGLNGNESMYFKNCNSIHTFFMKFDLDVIFVDRDLKIVDVKRNLKPNRMTIPLIHAAHVFEFEGGQLHSELQKGEQLYVEN